MKILLLTSCLLIPARCLADMTVVVKIGTERQTIYIKGQKGRMEYVEPTTPPRAVYEVMDLQAKRTTIVDRATGRAVTRIMDLPAEAEILKGLFADRTMEIRPTGVRTSINGFRCLEYRITVGGAVAKDVRYWVTSDIDTGEYDPFRQKVDAMSMMLGPGLRAVSGMPIRAEITTRAQPSEKTVIEVVRISREPLGDAFFTAPAPRARF
jgi:hypothetical protein